jgi:hypothetical protein
MCFIVILSVVMLFAVMQNVEAPSKCPRSIICGKLEYLSHRKKSA